MPPALVLPARLPPLLWAGIPSWTGRPLLSAQRGPNESDETRQGGAHSAQEGGIRDLKTDTHTRFPELTFNRGSEKRKGPLRAEAAF